MRRVMLASEILIAYARVRWLLRRQDLPRVLERIRRDRSNRAAGATDERLARAVRRTLRLLPVNSRCLMQSLVLTRLLVRRGRPSSLVIGVSPGGEFSAHAWVEREGAPLLPTHESEFERLAEL